MTAEPLSPQENKPSRQEDQLPAGIPLYTSGSLSEQEASEKSQTGSMQKVELLLPRLGDYLLQEGLITPTDLQRALTYQKNLQVQGRHLFLGQILIELEMIDQHLLDQAITHQLLGLHAALQEVNQQLEQRVQERTRDLEDHIKEIRVAAEITQLAISASSLDQLLKRTVHLIVERLGYFRASIFLLDDTGKSLILRETAGTFTQPGRQRHQRVLVGSRSMVGWVALNNQPRLTGNVKEEFLYRSEDVHADTHSEACIPIAVSSINQMAWISSPDQRLEEPGSVLASASDEAGKVAELALPGKVLGVLDVQHNQLNAFNVDAIAVLQTIANHIASVIQNFNLLDALQLRFYEVTALYDASHWLTQATNIEEVYQAISRALENTPKPSAFFTLDGNTLKLYSYHRFNPGQSGSQSEAESFQSTQKIQAQNSLPNATLLHQGPFKVLPSRVELDRLFNRLAQGKSGKAGQVASITLEVERAVTFPENLLAIPRQMGVGSATLIPIWILGKANALIVLGTDSHTLEEWSGTGTSRPGKSRSRRGHSQEARDLPRSTPPLAPETSDAEFKTISAATSLEAASSQASHPQTTSIVRSFVNLAELAAIVLEKLTSFETMEKRLVALQTLNTISQVVSVKTDLNELYHAVHTEVSRLMGDVDFLIAVFDPARDFIQIPYMFEVDRSKPGGGNFVTVEPFPLGEGLTSILIKTHKPLMLVEDTENRARQLGAKVVGRPAKSWLGVPLLVGGEPIGAIVVQDQDLEGRFGDDDLRLLSTLAAQVAVAIRNTRLLETTRQQADRERLLHEIISKIRSSSDMETILSITATELRKALGARRTHIEIDADTTL